MKLTDSLLQKIALFTAITGTILLFAFSVSIAPQQIPIEKISENLLGQDVKVFAMVQSQKFEKNTLVFEITDGAKIKAVKFSPTQQELQIVKEKNFLEVTGTVKQYRGELEIVVKKVTTID